MKRSFDWTHSRMELITEILDILSELIQEWNTFISPDSDFGYFSDFYESAFDLLESDSRVHAVRSFRNTRETFGRLQSHQQKLRSLIAKLTRDLEAVRYRPSFLRVCTKTQ